MGAVSSARSTGAPGGTCSSPKTYTGLGQGAHVFRLRASYGFDPGGHGPVAQRSWAVQASRTGDYPQAAFSEQRLTDRSSLAVNVSNGNLLIRDADLGIAGTGLDLEIDRLYNGLSDSAGSLGQGWSMGTGDDVRIRVEADGSVSFHDPTGALLSFQRRSDGSLPRRRGCTRRCGAPAPARMS